MVLGLEVGKEQAFESSSSSFVLSLCRDAMGSGGWTVGVSGISVIRRGLNALQFAR